MAVSTMKKSEDNIVYIELIMATIFWAGAFIAGKISIKEVPPMSVAFYRFLFASFIIFPIMLRWEKGNWKLNWGDIPVIMFLGIVGMFGYHVLFFIALKYTTAINSSIIASSDAIMINILSVLFLKNKISLKRAGAIALSFIGVLLIITNGDLNIIFNNKYNIGDLLMITAVACWSLYTIVSRKVMYKYSPVKITTYSFIVATVFLLPFFINDLSTGYLKSTTIKGWMSMLYMAVFPSVAGYLIWQIGIQKIGVSKTSLFKYLVPVFSIILSVSLLGEYVSLFKIITAMLIILGVYLNTKIKDTTES